MELYCNLYKKPCWQVYNTEGCSEYNILHSIDGCEDIENDSKRKCEHLVKEEKG